MSDRPDIVVLQADTVTTRALGYYGSWIRTPHLDALARDGVLFERMYQPANMCKPSRVSWMTGTYPWTHHVYTNEFPNRREQPTLLRRFADEGWRGGYLGLFHCWNDLDRDGMDAWSWVDWEWDWVAADAHDAADGPRTRAEHFRRLAAMDIWPTQHHLKDFRDHAGYTDFPIRHHLCTRLTDEAIRCIDDFRAGRPHFLWYSSWMPHEPWAAPAPYHELYRDGDVELPGSVHDRRETRPEHQRGGCYAQWDGVGDAALKRIWRAYGGMMTYVDDNVGRIIARLKADGRYDDALIVFCTDHGTTHGAHGWMYKGGSYMIDEISRVPFILKLPRGRGAGRRVADIVASVDLLPTLMEAAGIAAPPCEGRSLLPLVDGARREGARAFGVHNAGDGDQPDAVRSLRTGRWKYNLYAAGGGEELYDLDGDPDELRNLARAEPAIARGLRAELVDAIRSSPDRFVVPERLEFAAG